MPRADREEGHVSSFLVDGHGALEDARGRFRLELLLHKHIRKDGADGISYPIIDHLFAISATSLPKLVNAIVFPVFCEIVYFLLRFLQILDFID